MNNRSFSFLFSSLVSPRRPSPPLPPPLDQPAHHISSSKRLLQHKHWLGNRTLTSLHAPVPSVVTTAWLTLSRKVTPYISAHVHNALALPSLSPRPHLPRCPFHLVSHTTPAVPLPHDPAPQSGSTASSDLARITTRHFFLKHKITHN